MLFSVSNGPVEKHLAVPSPPWPVPQASSTISICLQTDYFLNSLESCYLHHLANDDFQSSWLKLVNDGLQRLGFSFELFNQMESSSALKVLIADYLPVL